MVFVTICKSWKTHAGVRILSCESKRNFPQFLTGKEPLEAIEGHTMLAYHSMQFPVLSWGHLCLFSGLSCCTSLLLQTSYSLQIFFITNLEFVTSFPLERESCGFSKQCHWAFCYFQVLFLSGSLYFVPLISYCIMNSCDLWPCLQAFEVPVKM